VIKLLIDECLTPDLADIARARWIEASHVARIGYKSAPDWSLVEFAVRSDFGSVTNNARDYRRLYQKVDLHPGLLIIVPQGRHHQQVALFRKLLDYLESSPDIVNQLVEIDDAGHVTVTPWSNVNI
jgi:predicted nuclease of predicted toxin-antitoxin system